MINFGQETHLGKRAFIILCLEKSKIPGISALITVIFVLLKDMLPSSMLSIISSIITILVIITVLAFAVAFVVGWLDYHDYSFVFEEYDVRLKRGLIKKRETSIPYRQIQNINIERDTTHQMFGLSKVIIETAGRDETDAERGMSEVVIEAMDKKLAEEMRDMLQKKIGVQVVRPEATSTSSV